MRVSPYQETYVMCCPRGGELVGPGIILGWGGGGEGVPQISLIHPVLGMPFGCQVPRHHFHVALRESDLLEQSLLVGAPPPRHTEAAGLHIVTPKRKKRLTNHDHCISHIGAETYAVE